MADERAGDGVNPLHGFKSLIGTYFGQTYASFEEYPMYKYLTVFSSIAEIPLTD